MIEFTVFGEAKPAGSKKGFVHPHTKRVVLTDANPQAKPWQQEVKAAAAARMNGSELLRGPVVAHFTFYRSRPKGHYGTGARAGVVKASAPAFPATRPDALKLARGIEDALTGIVWADDAQIVEEVLRKRWGDPPRVVIAIAELGAPILADSALLHAV